MRLSRLKYLVTGWLLVGAMIGLEAQGPNQPKPVLVNVIALTGATLVDVTDFGRSAKDLPDAVVLIHEGKILEAGSRQTVQVPKGAKVIDCSGKYIIPGLIDGYAGLNSQGQANAFLYMGVTTVVGVSDYRRGWVMTNPAPGPHVYLMDSVGSSDNWSLLGNRLGGRSQLRGQSRSAVDWAAKLREAGRPTELNLEDTSRQLTDIARAGVRVVWLGPNLTAANVQWIVAHAHQMGLVAYGDFVATPYKVGVEAGVDALPGMEHYLLGAITDELQKPLAEDPFGSSASTARDYSQKVPTTDLHLRNYARLLGNHHSALMPSFSRYFQRLPEHRNLWKEPVASLIDPQKLNNPPDPLTGEMRYQVSAMARHSPTATARWIEDGYRKRADQGALRMWQINEEIFGAYPRYLAASGSGVDGALPGISLHIELEMLVRLGMTPREALAAATSNYSAQFGWSELGLIAPGRRADLLVVDGNPAQNIWNARRISTIMIDGIVVERESLLNGRR